MRGVTPWIEWEECNKKVLKHTFSSVLPVGDLDTNSTGSPIQVHSRSVGDLGFHLSGLEVALKVLACVSVE